MCERRRKFGVNLHCNAACTVCLREEWFRQTARYITVGGRITFFIQQAPKETLYNLLPQAANMSKPKYPGTAAQKPRDPWQLAALAEEAKTGPPETQTTTRSSSKTSRLSAYSPAATSSSSSSSFRRAQLSRTANDVAPKRFAMPRSKSPTSHNHRIQTPWEGVRPPREAYPHWYDEAVSEVQWYLSLPDQFRAVRKPKGHR